MCPCALVPHMSSMYFLPEHHTDFVFTVHCSPMDLLMLLVVAFSAAVVAARYRTFLMALGLSVLALAAGGACFLLFGPKGLFIRYPVIRYIVLWIELAVIFGAGLLLGVLAQMAYQRFGTGENSKRR